MRATPVQRWAADERATPPDISTRSLARPEPCAQSEVGDVRTSTGSGPRPRDERLPPTAAGDAHHGVTGSGWRRLSSSGRGLAWRPVEETRTTTAECPHAPSVKGCGRSATGGSSRPSWCRGAFGPRRGGEGGLRCSSRVGRTGAKRDGRPARPSRATACHARRACSGRRSRRLPSRVGCRPRPRSASECRPGLRRAALRRATPLEGAPPLGVGTIMCRTTPLSGNSNRTGLTGQDRQRTRG